MNAAVTDASRNRRQSHGRSGCGTARRRHPVRHAVTLLRQVGLEDPRFATPPSGACGCTPAGSKGEHKHAKPHLLALAAVLSARRRAATSSPGEWGGGSMCVALMGSGSFNECEKDVCQAAGGHLACFSSDDAYRAVYEALLHDLKGGWPHGCAFFGLHHCDSDEGEWEWTTSTCSTEFDFPWANGEPNDYAGSEDCGMVCPEYSSTGDAWNDGPCHNKISCLCQEASEATVLNYSSNTCPEAHWAGGSRCRSSCRSRGGLLRSLGVRTGTVHASPETKMRAHTRYHRQLPHDYDPLARTRQSDLRFQRAGGAHGSTRLAERRDRRSCVLPCRAAAPDRARQNPARRDGANGCSSARRGAVRRARGQISRVDMSRKTARRDSLPHRCRSIRYNRHASTQDSWKSRSQPRVPALVAQRK